MEFEEGINKAKIFQANQRRRMKNKKEYKNTLRVKVLTIGTNIKVRRTKNKMKSIGLQTFKEFRCNERKFPPGQICAAFSINLIDWLSFLMER